jgi:putative transposase
MFALLASLLRILVSPANFRDVALENLALRHQLAVFKRNCPRPRLRRMDRVFWVWLSRSWKDWRRALLIVRPETVVDWHRKGFRLFWTWISRRKRCGRPEASAEVRALIRKMAEANPFWGAPRIHGELLKLGIGISERTVSRLLPRNRKPPSQTWRTFLDNHVNDLVSIDFFTVPTATFRVLFVFVVLAHRRRHVLHFNVTEHPTAAWTAQQILEAFSEDRAPRYLIRDRDQVYGEFFRNRLRDLGTTEVLTAPQSPWQNPFAERLVGSIRRECLDHVIVLGGETSTTNPEKLFRLLSSFEDSLVFSQGRSDNSCRAGAGGWRDRGVPAGRWPAPSLRTARCMTECSLAFPSLPSRTATCLVQGGHLAAQRLDQLDDITDQKPWSKATRRVRGL